MEQNVGTILGQMNFRFLRFLPFEKNASSFLIKKLLIHKTPRKIIKHYCKIKQQRKVYFLVTLWLKKRFLFFFYDFRAVFFCQQSIFMIRLKLDFCAIFFHSDFCTWSRKTRKMIMIANCSFYHSIFSNTTGFN